MVNVLLPELRDKVRKDVPFIPGAWVELYTDVKMATVRKAQEAQKNTSLDGSFALIIDQIADWNFSNEKDEKLPIEIATLDLLSGKLLKWITETQTEVINTPTSEDKKKE